MNNQKKNPVERLLGLFTKVEPGEGTTCLLLTLNVFALLTTYYILKPVREALILVGGGAEIKSYAAAGQGLLLLGAVPLYGILAAKFPRRLLINLVTLFFVACLVAFYVLAQMDVSLGVVFYLWVGIFNLMVIAQFWAFANDVYTVDMGNRLFPVVAFGASAGAVFGSALAGKLIEPVGVYQLLLLAAGLLALTLLVTNLVDRRDRRPSGDRDVVVADEPLGTENAFMLVLRNRYLLLIALMILLLNFVNTTGEYILGKTIATAASQAVADGTAGELNEKQFIGQFYASFFTVVNLVGLVFQLFFVSRIVRFLGLRVAILVLPVIAFGGYALLAFFPVLAVVRWAKTAENATDYSLQNTVRQILFLPTTREQKYKAKQAIDSFFVRAGDVLSALLVYVGINLLAFRTAHFAMVNMTLVLVWIVISVLIGRHNRKLTAEV